MEECNGTCGEHGSLATDIKWIQRSLYGGMFVLFSAIVYFNQASQDTMMKLQQSTMQVHQLLTESRASHALDLARMDNRQDSFEILCCGEVRDD